MRAGIKVFMGFAAVVFIAGFVIFAARNTTELERELKAALKKDPADSVSAVKLGVLYWEQGRVRRAVSNFRSAVTIDPEQPLPYYFLGEAYFLDREPERAVYNFSLFLEKIPPSDEIAPEHKDHFISALDKVGRRAWSMKEYETSFNAFSKITEIEPVNARARYNLAVYYYNYENNRVKAFSELERVLETEQESRLGAKAEFFMDYIRRNPDSRLVGDMSFIDEGR